jgi:hypothetical protein
MDHTTTLAGGRSVLALDMYKHSYHIDYGANAAALRRTDNTLSPSSPIRPAVWRFSQSK